MVSKRTAFSIAGFVLFCYNPFIFFAFLYVYIFYILIKHRGELVKYFRKPPKLYFTAWDNIDKLISNKFEHTPEFYIKLRNAFNVDHMKKDAAGTPSIIHQLKKENPILFHSILVQLNKASAVKYGFQLKRSEISVALAVLNNAASAQQCSVESFMQSHPETVRLMFAKFVDIVQKKRLAGETIGIADTTNMID